MHFLVCGLGQVGYRTVNLLRMLGHAVSVVTQATREDWIQELANSGVDIHLGDARQDAVLRAAGLDYTDAVLVVTSDDAINVQIALHIRRVNPDSRVIVRTFDTNLGQQIRSQLGIEDVVAIPEVAGPVLAANASSDQVLARLTTASGRHQVQRINDSWALTSVNTLSLAERQASVNKREAWKALAPQAIIQWIIRIWRGTTPQLRAVFLALNIFGVFSVLTARIGLNLSLIDAIYFVVTTITTTGFGDISALNHPVWVKIFVSLLMLLGSASIAIVYSIVTDYIVSSRLSQAIQQVKVPAEGHVIVAGLGDIGIQVIRELHRDGLEVVVIDLETSGSHLQSIRSSVSVLFGEARDSEVLNRANIKTAKALIVATGNDGINLGIGLAARSIEPNLRVVLRIFDQDLLHALNANLVFTNVLSPAFLAACEFVAMAIAPGSKSGFTTEKSFWTVDATAITREHPFVA